MTSTSTGGRGFGPGRPVSCGERVVEPDGGAVAFASSPPRSLDGRTRRGPGSRAPRPRAYRSPRRPPPRRRSSVAVTGWAWAGRIVGKQPRRRRSRRRLLGRPPSPRAPRRRPGSSTPGRGESGGAAGEAGTSGRVPQQGHRHDRHAQNAAHTAGTEKRGGGTKTEGRTAPAAALQEFGEPAAPPRARSGRHHGPFRAARSAARGAAVSKGPGPGVAARAGEGNDAGGERLGTGGGSGARWVRCGNSPRGSRRARGRATAPHPRAAGAHRRMAGARRRLRRTQGNQRLARCCA